MYPDLRRLSLAAVMASLFAVTGCDSSSHYDQYDRPYDGYSYGRQPAYDQRDAYERGYRDGQRQPGYNRYGAQDYERGYERGRKEAEREQRRAAKEERREREARDEWRRREEQRRGYDYRRPADVRPPVTPPQMPGSPPPAPGTWGINDG